jgi:hypothetical protein
MFNKKPIIEYQNSELTKYYDNSFVPSVNLIPKWYKDSPKWRNNEVSSVPQGGINSTVKSCYPFLQAMSNGYTLTLPIDIYIKRDGDAPFITWKQGAPEVLLLRPPKSHEGVPVPHGHEPLDLAWLIRTCFRVPVGYSWLFTHPLNRFDLPFTTLSGIVDGGFTMPDGATIPFYLKSGFSGVIEQGTPIAQIIPFKNNNWKSVESDKLLLESHKQAQMSKSKLSGWYQKTWWNKKTYE